MEATKTEEIITQMEVVESKRVTRNNSNILKKMQNFKINQSWNSQLC
jgi:hypothetical protein